MLGSFQLKLATVVLLAASSVAHADLTSGSTITIPMDGDGLPADDLVNPNGSGLLTPEDALQLEVASTTPHYLSTLNPDPTTDIWQTTPTTGDESLDQALPINSGDTVTYLASLLSPQGFYFRFNVQTANGGPLTLMAGRTLHAMLLRKEIFRRLGFRIPAMKYLPTVSVTFPDASTRDFFLTTQMPNATSLPSSRYVVGSTSGLTVTFQDMVALQATPQFYNVVLGAPQPSDTQVLPEPSRLTRVLGLVYGLANVPESVNQYDWYVGRVQSGDFTFAVPDLANFALTLDDMLWFLNRLAPLTRADFTAAVAASDFPDPVAELAVEKLISRRDSLMQAFSVTAPAITPPADTSLTVGDGSVIKNGKILQQAWPGYASHFAAGDQPSPLQDLRYYALSELISNVTENLIDYANTQIPQLSIGGAETAHEQALETGIAQYLQGGQPQSVPLGVWAAPIASGGVEISRDVVIGNYLGTNNLIQLVDTFGFDANAGVFIGVDGLPAAIDASAMVEATVNYTLTHVRPLTSLKQSITQPLQNEFVPWVTFRAADQLDQLAALEQNPGTQTPSQLNQELTNDMNQLRTYLAPGDSLILTESLTGTEEASVGVTAPIPLSPSGSIELSGSQIVVSRVQIYREPVPNDDTVVVFKDKGQLDGVTVAFVFSVGTALASFPVIQVSAEKMTGSGDSDVYTLSILPDMTQNTQFPQFAVALATAIRTGSVEQIAALEKPLKLSTQFTDSTSQFQFFSWVDRTLKTNSEVEITLPNGQSGDYLSLSDGKQTGSNIQSLLTEAATFVAQQISGNGTWSIDTQASSNPGQTFLGNSQTRDVSFQSLLGQTGIETPIVRIEQRWEGWQMSAGDMQSLMDQQAQYFGVTLFADGFLGTATDVKLYQIQIWTDIYEAGIENLLNMSQADLQTFEQGVYQQHGCQQYLPDEGDMSPADALVCGQLMQFDYDFNSYRSDLVKAAPTPPAAPDPTLERKVASDTLELVSELSQFVSFTDLVTMVGGPGNIYVSGMINGFYDGSEESGPIQSTGTYGTGAVDNPNPSGVLDSAQQILQIPDGEFKLQWLRDIL